MSHHFTAVVSFLLLTALGTAIATPPTVGTSISGDPDLCTTEPRSDSFFEPYLGTPGRVFSPDNRVNGTPAALVSPGGTAVKVDTDLYESIVAVMTQFNACATAGQPASVAALMTDEAAGEFVQNFGADYVSAEHEASNPTTLLLTSVLEQTHGTVWAVVMPKDPEPSVHPTVTQAYHLVQESGGWKISDVQVLSVVAP